MERLFVYGTLRQPEVQIAVWGRKVEGTPGTLVGFKVERQRVEAAEVVELSGTDDHPILVRGHGEDEVAGLFLNLTAAELAQADAYEIDAYERVRARSNDGGEAWAYVRREPSSTATLSPAAEP